MTTLYVVTRTDLEEVGEIETFRLAFKTWEAAVEAIIEDITSSVVDEDADKVRREDLEIHKINLDEWKTDDNNFVWTITGVDVKD